MIGLLRTAARALAAAARLTDQRPQPVHNRFIKELFSDRHADSFTILFVADVLHPVDVLAVE
jgi:hypothetical protein